MRDLKVERAPERVGLVVVGNGQPEHARDFLDHAGGGFELYTDPSLRAYKRLGFKRSVLALLSGKIFKRGKVAREAGHRQGRTRGDALQLGGVYIVRRGGEIAYSYKSEFPGDHPSSEAIGEALDSLGS